VFGSYKDKAGKLKRFRGTEATLAQDVPAGATEVKLTRSHSRLETYVSAGAPSKAVFKPTGSGPGAGAGHASQRTAQRREATFRFLLDGKPAANQGVSLIPGGVRYRGTLGEIRKTTDANGEVSFELPAAGMYCSAARGLLRRQRLPASRRDAATPRDLRGRAGNPAGISLHAPGLTAACHQ
jgi:hypothetical protein